MAGSWRAVARLLRLFVCRHPDCGIPPEWLLVLRPGQRRPPGTGQGWTLAPSWPPHGLRRGQAGPWSRRSRQSRPAPEAAVLPPSLPSHRCERLAPLPLQPAAPCAYAGTACSGTSCRACRGACGVGRAGQVCGIRAHLLRPTHWSGGSTGAAGLEGVATPPPPRLRPSRPPQGSGPSGGVPERRRALHAYWACAAWWGFPSGTPTVPPPAALPPAHLAPVDKHLRKELLR